MKLLKRWQILVFFLMLHTGVETEPKDFYQPVKDSRGVEPIYYYRDLEQ